MNATISTKRICGHPHPPTAPNRFLSRPHELDIPAYINATHLCRAVKESGCILGEKAERIICKSQNTLPTNQGTQIRMHIISVSGLGFEYGASLEEIYVQASTLSWSLCPPVIGPVVAIWNQLLNEEEVYFGMDPVVYSLQDLRPHILSLRYGCFGRCLRAAPEPIDGLWLPERKFIFIEDVPA